MLRKAPAAYTTGCKPEIHREARGKNLSYISCISLSIFCIFLFIITVIKKVFSWINITEQRIQCDLLSYTTNFFSSNLAINSARLYSNRNCHLFLLYKIPLCYSKPEETLSKQPCHRSHPLQKYLLWYLSVGCWFLFLINTHITTVCSGFSIHPLRVSHWEGSVIIILPTGTGEQFSSGPFSDFHDQGKTTAAVEVQIMHCLFFTSQPHFLS